MSSALGPFLQGVLTRNWAQRTLLSWTLWPISILLGAWVRLRRYLYRYGLLKTQRIGVPVVVVGNVLVGGVGKTPVVMALAEHLIQHGFKPGIVSRGYGRQSNVCQEVHTGSSALEVGDEPALIKRRLDIPVFVAAKRADAARVLINQHPTTNIIVCDDGLQHLALHRDIEVCVFDDRGAGNGFLLPAGPLREPWPRKVDLVVHTGQHPAFPGFRAHRSLQSKAYRLNGSTVELACLTAIDAPPLLAVAAVAQPVHFFEMLKAQGLHLSRTVALPDHDDFSQWQRPHDQDYLLLCTEKDAVKIWDQHPDALVVRLNCELDEAFLQALDQQLAHTLH